jgi:predicted DNA-binding mobile mystery protein A
MKRIALARRQLEQRLAPLREATALARPPRGWVRAVRDALGMTSKQLAERLQVDQSRIIRLEQAEADDAITLKSLRQAAEGLNCTLVYALVPNQPLDDIVRARAGEVADQQLARVDQTMRLENQALGSHRLKVERERLIEELLATNPRRLWDRA